VNVGEYGVPYLFSTGFDMSANTSISITFTKPDGTVLTVTNPAVTVPAVDVETTDGLFLAHKYVAYTFKAGDVDQVGIWSARVTYNDAGPRHLISDSDEFEVFP
jgi:hypothetical protein